MSGSSTNSIGCLQATDCAAAGYGIPANARYACDSQGRCTFECNSNYTLYSEACWLNGTVSTSCNCDPSRPSSLRSTLLPTAPPSSSTPSPTPVVSDDGEDADEVEETITVTQTSLSMITKWPDASPSALITPPPPSPTTTRHPKVVTVTELSISVVPYIPPIVSQTFTQTRTRTKTKTKLVTVTSVSISTVSAQPSTTRSSTSRVTKTTRKSAPLATATGNCCKKTPDCTQKIPQNAHRICLKELCKWRCNKNYTKKGGKCVKKQATATKPPIPPCGCVLPTASTVTKTVSPSTATKAVPAGSSATSSLAASSPPTLSITSSKKTQARSTRQVTATVTSTMLWTTEMLSTPVPTPTYTPDAVSWTTIFTAATPTSTPDAVSWTTIFTAATPTVQVVSQTITVSISPVRPLPTPRIIYIETCSCDEDCTINVPADAAPVCDPKLATCTWACNPGFWINSDGTGCLPDGTAFAAHGRKLMVLPPTMTRPHTYSLYIPTATPEAPKPTVTLSNSSAIDSSTLAQVSHKSPKSFAATFSDSTLLPNSTISSFSKSTPFLLQHYAPNSFLDRFFFADDGDESNGFVNYVESEEATELELTTFTNSTVTLSMDRASDLSDDEARDSVRLSSRELIQPRSLLIVDLAHVPTGCFVFPSIYLHGANGSVPLGGEIDILDGSAGRDYNRYTVRSPPGCSLAPQASGSGTAQSAACDNQEGCSIRGETSSSGERMNLDGGGAIAVQVDDNGISIWQWSRSQIPSDVAKGSPRRETWGAPVSAWRNTSCDMNSSFRDLRLAFDITRVSFAFPSASLTKTNHRSLCISRTCGAWRGKEAFSSEQPGTCASKYLTCAAAVRDSSNFLEAFFEINSVKVYSI
ncbi:hypothetical protein JCM16303_001727 [Sporobolomyces ruberrimus]